MSNNLLMRIKERASAVLLDYEMCDLHDKHMLDETIASVSLEIAERAVENYMDLVKMKKRLPFVDEAKAEIIMVIKAAANLDRDPWDVCRDENVRIRTAYSIARIIDGKAGARHKFSVWSGISYGTKTSYGKGIYVVVAAASAQKAVASVNSVLGGRENVSSFRDHWGSGGTVGEALATKIGIWVAKKESYPHTERDYALVWEPKS